MSLTRSGPSAVTTAWDIYNRFMDVDGIRVYLDGSDSPVTAVEPTNNGFAIETADGAIYDVADDAAMRICNPDNDDGVQ